MRHFSVLHFHKNSLSAQFMQVQAATDKLVNINIVGIAETTEISCVGVVHLFLANDKHEFYLL